MGGRGGQRREEGKGDECNLCKGKQAESPVRGKFTLVWWGAEVEERQDRCR